MAFARTHTSLVTSRRDARSKYPPSYRRRFVPAVETLDHRVLPAVTAMFTPAGEGLLRVLGDSENNVITVSRDSSGTILVNDGAVVIQGGPATVANTHQIFILGQAGDDRLALAESNGAMPAASLFGGDGNDVMFGGSANDFCDGGAGADSAFLGAGDDTFLWNPGNGSDTIEGQAGWDTLVFNGSDDAELIDIAANANRVRFTRDVGSVTMDLNGLEVIDFNAFGGADSITVNDQTATDIFGVNIDLNASAGVGDDEADAVIINGTDGDDFGQIAAFDNGTLIGAVVSVFPFVGIRGAEGMHDNLIINARGGDDVMDAGFLPADLIGLTLNGGIGNDELVAGSGGDLVNGGPGSDTAFLGDGDDTFVWNPGDGRDTVEGQGGLDLLLFNGSNDSERIDISDNNGRVEFLRDVGNIQLDLGAFEGIDFNASDGVDVITVNDLSGTDLVKIRLNLNGSAGPGDGQADAVIINATNDDDNIRITALGDNLILVDGLFPFVDITRAEPANDRLTVNTLDGNDQLDASNLPANRIGLTLNGGAGNNVILAPLFGDSDGDGDVDATDFAAFRSAFGGSTAIFDFDGDGDVDTTDFSQFRLRFGSSV